MRSDRSAGSFIAYTLVTLFVLVFLVGAVIAGSFGCKAYTRYQKRADAKNNVKVTAIQIQNQKQRVLIAQQQAQIRYQNAIGIKRAQDEIQKTLTPLYVQFEMVDALKNIATSGRNNSVVYIPSGANGIPLVSTTNGNQVLNPNGSK